MLRMIQWESRQGLNTERDFRVSVNGTDFSICEPWPFDTKLYSHKFKVPGVRYEVGVCIAPGNII